MNLKISTLLLTTALIPALKSFNESQAKDVPIKGTWHLVSGITIQKGDTTFTDYRKGSTLR